MSNNAELADLYSAIEESARLLKVPYAYEKVRTVLSAYEDSLPKALIAFRMGTGDRYAGDVDWRFSLPNDIDPYAVALARDLIGTTDHPVSTLLSEVAEVCPVYQYGVDFGVAGGFKKVYAFFPTDNPGRLSELAGLPSIPHSVAGSRGFFTRHGVDVDQMNVFGIDYRHRTVNVYFSGVAPEVFAADNVRSMFRELELPEPSEHLLRLSERAFGLYATFGWDSPGIERYCLSVKASDPTELPVPMEPEIEKFLANVPREASDGGFVYHIATSSTGEALYKVQAYYKWKPWLQGQMMRTDTLERDAS